MDQTSPHSTQQYFKILLHAGRYLNTAFKFSTSWVVIGKYVTQIFITPCVLDPPVGKIEILVDSEQFESFNKLIKKAGNIVNSGDEYSLNIPEFDRCIPLKFIPSGTDGYPNPWETNGARINEYFDLHSLGSTVIPILRIEHLLSIKLMAIIGSPDKKQLITETNILLACMNCDKTVNCLPGYRATLLAIFHKYFENTLTPWDVWSRLGMSNGKISGSQLKLFSISHRESDVLVNPDLLEFGETPLPAPLIPTIIRSPSLAQIQAGVLEWIRLVKELKLTYAIIGENISWLKKKITPISTKNVDILISEGDMNLAQIREPPVIATTPDNEKIILIDGNMGVPVSFFLTGQEIPCCDSRWPNITDGNVERVGWQSVNDYEYVVLFSEAHATLDPLECPSFIQRMISEVLAFHAQFTYV
jgi:hypothetical protein